MIALISHKEVPIRPSDSTIRSGFYSTTYSRTVTGGVQSGSTSGSTSGTSVTSYNSSSESVTAHTNGTGGGGFAYAYGTTITREYEYSYGPTGYVERFAGLVSSTGSSSANLYDDADPPNITGVTDSHWTGTGLPAFEWIGGVLPFTHTGAIPPPSATTPDTRTYEIYNITYGTSSSVKTYVTARATTMETTAYTSKSTSIIDGTTSTSAGTTATTTISCHTISTGSTSEASGVEWVGDMGEEVEVPYTYEDVVAFTATISESYLVESYITVTGDRSKSYATEKVGKCQDNEILFVFGATGMGRLDDIAIRGDMQTIGPLQTCEWVASTITAIDSSCKVTITNPAHTGVSVSYSTSDYETTYAVRGYSRGLPESTSAATHVFRGTTTSYGLSLDTYWAYTYTARASGTQTSYGALYKTVAGRGKLAYSTGGICVDETSAITGEVITVTEGINVPTSKHETGTDSVGGSTYEYAETWIKFSSHEARTAPFLQHYGVAEISQQIERPLGQVVVMPLDMTGGASASFGAAISASPPVPWLPAISAAFVSEYSAYYGRAPVSYGAVATMTNSDTSIRYSIDGNTLMVSTYTPDSSGAVEHTLITIGSVPTVNSSYGYYGYYLESTYVISPHAEKYGLGAGVYRIGDGSTFGDWFTVEHAETYNVAAGMAIEPVGWLAVIENQTWRPDAYGDYYRLLTAYVPTPSIIL